MAAFDHHFKTGYSGESIFAYKYLEAEIENILAIVKGPYGEPMKIRKTNLVAMSLQEEKEKNTELLPEQGGRVTERIYLFSEFRAFSPLFLPSC